MPDLPTGTVTFLFTDIEGSTRRWEQHPEAMRTALARHDALLRAAIEAHDGYVFKTVGDAFCAAFSTAPDALEAALDAQRALFAEAWGPVGPLRVRMVLHTGDADERGGDYFGPPVNRVARLLSAGHGGQVLLSAAAQELVRDQLPPGAALHDHGEQRLKDLQRPERVFQLVVADLPAEFPPLRTLDSRPNNLPAQTTPLVGREEEIAAARARLLHPDVRLLTLTGPGGSGKTRLGLQVAAESLDDFDDGVFFVPLAAISDPSLLASTIAQALGVREAAGRPVLESLKEYLADKQLLVLLDNFEQLVDAAPQVSDLLAAGPGVKVLVTSRAVLRVYGEHEFHVPPLQLPDPGHLPSLERLTQYEAVRLFIERAQAVNLDFAVTNENAPAVAAICHRLDGLPLAIELAAARIRLLTPQAMLARLEHRLSLLTGGARNLPARQQTLRGALAWSYDLLDAGEQALFCRLGVFVGGCTLEAAEAVCDPSGDLAIDLLDGVDSLVAKSLLRHEEAADGAEPRFQMLETIREYALERLAERSEADTLRRRHVEYYLALAEQAAEYAFGPEQDRWLGRLELEHDNLRAALKWLQTDAADDDTAVRLAGALWPFWYVRGYLSEGRAALNEALARGRPGTAAARALNGAAILNWFQGDQGRAVAYVQESLALARASGDQRGLAFSLAIMGEMALFQDGPERGTPLLEESARLFRALGDRWGVALASLFLGQAALRQDDHERAEALVEESLGLFREVRDKWGTGFSLGILGMVARYEQRYERAAALFEEALPLQRGLGDKMGVAGSLLNLGMVARDLGEYDRARGLVEQALEVFRPLGHRWNTSEALEVLGEIAQRQGDYARAVALHDEALALRRELEPNPGIARSLINLGLVAGYQGDFARAAALHREALTLLREMGEKGNVAEGLEGLAEIASAQGQPQRAARLLGAAEALREAIRAPRSPADHAEHERLVAAVRAGLDAGAFETAWAAGRAQTVAEAIAFALEEPSAADD
ncbi:MAG TPA: tetratricopeptide repeat protein [Chloroflexota bacterium]|nr:tetratricopeptide repeat protein [Chloroflexota bacterium]